MTLNESYEAVRPRYAVRSDDGVRYYILRDGKRTCRSWWYSSEVDALYQIERLVEVAATRLRRRSAGLLRPRDAKRQRAYAAERAAYRAPGSAWARCRYDTLDDARKLIQTTAEKAGLPFLPSLTLTVNTGKRVRTGAWARRIDCHIHFGAMTELEVWLILHEYAHLLTDAKGEPGHGPTWARTYVRLAKAYDVQWGEALEREFLNVYKGAL